MHLPGIRLIILTALGLAMRFFKTLFYLHVQHVHLTLLNLYLFLPQRIQKYVPESKLLAIKVIINPILSSLILNLTASTLACTNCSAVVFSLGAQGTISFASPSSDTFCFSLPHPSPSHIHGNAEDPVTLWLIPSQTQWVYNISTSPTHHRKYSFLMELFWSS